MREDERVAILQVRGEYKAAVNEGVARLVLVLASAVVVGGIVSHVPITNARGTGHIYSTFLAVNYIQTVLP